MFRRILGLALVVSCLASFASAQNLFFEDFQGLTGDLQTAIDAPNGEGPSGQNNVDPNRLGWTHTTPSGWFRDVSGVPTVGNPDAGVAEWEGWSFATLDFWVDADDQRRSEFQADTAIPRRTSWRSPTATSGMILARPPTTLVSTIRASSRQRSTFRASI